MILVAIVDDHQPAREKLKAFLIQLPQVELVYEESNAIQFINTYERLTIKPDIAIIDYLMSPISGISVIHFFHKYYPKTKLLCVTGYNDIDTIKQIFGAGADGFAYKFEISAEILMEAIEAITSNNLYIQPLTNTDIATVTLLKQNALLSINKRQLTKREYLYTTLIAEPALTNKNISTLLNISEKTAESIGYRLSKKMSIVGKRLELYKISLTNNLVKLATVTSKRKVEW